MKNKKVVKTIVFVILILLFVYGLYNLFCIFTKEKLRIDVKSCTSCSSGSDFNALVKVCKTDNSKPVGSKLKLKLYNSDGKKVKDLGTKIDIKKGEQKNVSLKLPDELQNGNYELEITANSGFLNNSIKIPINITENSKTNAIISLDKGIYKPGDQVNYRALLVSNSDYVPEKQEVTVSIYDGNSNRVYIQTAETSEYGIISGTFNLGDEINSGNYTIKVNNKSQEFTKSFIVNPYITPKFEAAIVTDKENYLVGETAQITISGKYFFGEPVAEASVKGKINDKEIVGITNAEGNFVTNYQITQKGKQNLNFEIIDKSNYAVETSKTLTCGTNIFEIEILPEYGDIIENVNNDIYVLTKTISGEPVKTYANLTISNITKQIIIDESGIGSFTLTSDDISSLKYGEENFIDITCQDMNGNKVQKQEKFNLIKNYGTLIKTDKVKYLAGEDIEVSLQKYYDSPNNVIYVCKNDEVLKIFSTEDTEFKFNLDNITGLIDIYVSKDNRVYDNGRYIEKTIENLNKYDYNKKTIFVKPNESLNIEIETDSEEYKPSENLNVKFTTTDENKSPIDSALLVSILDEAVLNLAENDLSIDNIKLALQDIELSEGITAADLYAMVVSDTSDVNLNAIMLKQKRTVPEIVDFSTYYLLSESEDYIMHIAVTFLMMLLIYFGYIICLKKKVSRIIIIIINVIIITLIISLILGELLYDYIGIDFSICLITCFIISIILYTLLLHKENEYIFKLSMELVIVPFIILSMLIFCIMSFEIEPLIVFLLLLSIILGNIVIYASMKSKFKDKKLGEMRSILFIFSGIILKAILFWLATLITSAIFNQYSFIIILIAYIFFERVIFNEHEKKPIKDGKIVINITGLGVISLVIAGVLILLVLFGMAEIINSLTRTFGEEPYYDDFDSATSINSSDRNDNISFSSVIPGSVVESAEDTTGTASIKSNGLFDSITSIFDNTKGTINDSMASIPTSELEKHDEQEKNETTSEIEENVRNVFLESLVFIPELVTENGKAETKITLSDNITTWNIQTVGNTKSGNIGYATSSFKVFKEFFVDFSLPTNSVVTDKVSIPITLYNYTAQNLSIDVNVVENDWSKIGEYEKNVVVPANSTFMIYVPIEIINSGDNILRIETKANNVSDIVEKKLKVSINGLAKESVVSSGTIEENYSQDIIFDENVIDGTKNLKVKLYASAIAQAIEGIEGMLSLPTGCFEQTSSSLYPDILVLKYLKQNNLNNEELKKKALEYISKGYQKLLTYEVRGEKGGYSLYGNSPAEPVITAFGLMEFKELSEVYKVDENIINNMIEYLFSEQKTNGTFDYKSTYIGGAEKVDEYSMNAYIVWALSEVCPEDSRLEKSINYLQKNLDKISDNYTLALIANIFANTNKEKEAKEVLKEITRNLKISNDIAYVSTNSYDYYGTHGKYQNIQASALTSIALSKLGESVKNNNLIINYLIQSKSSNGTWGTTQSTILALKAINIHSEKSNISEQTLVVSLNGEEKKIDIKKDALDYYEVEFENVSTENKLSIQMKKGKIAYEVIKEYYVDYKNIGNNEYDISLTQSIDNKVKVNDTIKQTINITNNYNEITNGLLQINIPQGATVLEESLLKLKYDGKIDKYEYNYGKINIYVRNFQKGNSLSFDIQYKALYPVNITGASIRFYDYYNPEVEVISLPININVSN